ncbi:MAG: xanthine dehydrogenase family protein molybdopterin-binding subunit [Spirochaetaceae bacterium]
MGDSISRPARRVDADAKSRGEARYIADYQFSGLKKALYIRSPVARGVIRAVEPPELPEGYQFVTVADIPEGGKNAVPMISDDWKVFAEGEVRYLGEPLGLLVGPEQETLLELAKGFTIDIEERQAAFSEEEGINLVGGPIHGKDNLFSEKTVEKGDLQEAFRTASRVYEDSFETGIQEHVYMEPQGVVGTVEEGQLVIYISTQCPFYVRKGVAGALGVAPEKVTVRQSVTGGGFGGKEHYPDTLAAAVAVAVGKLGGPIQLIMEREEDMLYSTKRHPSKLHFRAAVDEHNRIIGLDVDVVINAGAYESGSGVVLQRAMFTSSGVYDIPNIRVHGRAVCTNTVPNDAFRGFGAPQALFGVEGIFTHIARHLGIDEAEFRLAHMVKKGSVTVTSGRIRENVVLPEMLEHVLARSGYRKKRDSYGLGRWRGIGISTFQHGSAFTGSGERDIIKAKVAIKRHADGRPEIKVSTVEIGQGAVTTLRKIVAEELGIPVEDVLYHDPDTSGVPDSGPTCASRSVAVVGYLLQEAAKKLKARMEEPGEFEVQHSYEHPPGLEWDQETFTGDAYPSYSWGANVVEVSVDPYTYEVTVEGVWTAYDIGRAIDELVVQGQIEGGASQGLGYAALERMELGEGRYRQVTMADYMIPTSLDFPPIYSKLFDNPYEYGPSGAKGAGEVVFDGIAPALAAAVEQAIAAPVRAIPVCPERIAEILRERGTTGDTIHPQWTEALHHRQPDPAVT